MSTLTRPNLHTSRLALSVLFWLGVVLLIGIWIVLYWSESLFTESHLVGYSCCVTEQDLPAPGTLERMASDFFRTSPGMYLPPLVFVAANVGIFAISVWYARKRKRWWLPFLFVAFGALYLPTDLCLVRVSWLISDWLVGPPASVYKGYHRTWYGVVLHLVLWLGYLAMLSSVPIKLRSEPRAKAIGEV
jgi:hypothetical protein